MLTLVKVVLVVGSDLTGFTWQMILAFRISALERENQDLLVLPA
jgi:hypothetical protein